jgi:hypothetical protein
MDARWLPWIIIVAALLIIGWISNLTGTWLTERRVQRNSEAREEREARGEEQWQRNARAYNIVRPIKNSPNTGTVRGKFLNARQNE